jgi:hypothetical protein
LHLSQNLSSFLGVTNLDDWWMEQTRIEEASLRYSADLPARDEREQDFYRSWTERDAADPRSAADDAVYAAYLRTRTPEQLRDLAVSAIAAERETGTIAPGWLAEAEQTLPGEADLEAGS